MNDLTNTKGTNEPQSNQTNTPTLVKDNSYHRVVLQCCIRRKPLSMGLPGQDPAERIYKIGSSLDSRAKGNLKGISGDLELKFMPEIVALSSNDPQYRTAIDEYWSSISATVPPDEPFLAEHLMGVPIKLVFKVLGKARKEKVENYVTIEERLKVLNQFLLETTEINGKDVDCAVLEYESISDYLLLSYSLKYSRVANRVEDIDKSAKIWFYIFEKAIAVKDQLNFVEMAQKAMKLYGVVSTDDNKLSRILLGFNKVPKTYENTTDKALEVFTLYNANKESLKLFVELAEDKDWETKYLIASGVSEQKLRKHKNSTAIYYGDTLIGMDEQDAVTMLDSENGKVIKEALLKELNIK
jgi:hypothetical protein